MTDFEKEVKEVAKALYGPGHVLDPDQHCSIAAMAHKLLDAAKAQIVKDGGILINNPLPPHGCDPGPRGPSGYPGDPGAKDIEELEPYFSQDQFGNVIGECPPNNFDLMLKINEIIRYLNRK